MSGGVQIEPLLKLQNNNRATDIMANESVIKLFEGKQVRIVWDEEQEKYYFSVVDIVQVLTGSSDYQQARKYWKVLKGRLIKEGNETVTNCYQLKLPAADGKKRLTDMADLQGIFRIIQSIPSDRDAEGIDGRVATQWHHGT